MSDFLEGINFPKHVVDFLKTLLGPAAQEIGEWAADPIKVRRYVNMHKALVKTEESLKAMGIRPSPVAMKTLFPLLVGASLEEDEAIRDMWANLLASAARGGGSIALHTVCIQVLKSISAFDAKVLQRLLGAWEREKENRGPEASLKRAVVKNPAISLELGIDPGDGEFVFDNLVRLGLAANTGGSVTSRLVHLTTLGRRVIEEVSGE